MVALTRTKPAITPTRPLAARVRALEELLGMLRPVPKKWLRGQSEASGGNSTSEGVGLDCLPCNNYRQLVVAWRKALKWTTGLDHALAVMLASITSTKSLGDQLWIKIIGCAACGKSTLCEALSVSSHVVAKSTIRGFHSGYKTEEDNGKRRQDHSLIPQIRNKTLIVKDGDTLLQSPNLQQILSEARDLYDGTSRTHYRNAVSKDYCGIHMTWLLCGTSSLRAIDSSELGERFLDCVIMDKIDSELENEILWRVASRAQRNLGIEVDGKPETCYAPELTKAMQLTGGYVDYLRKHAVPLLHQVEVSNDALRQCVQLGKFVAYMRARPSKLSTMLGTGGRELGARLVEQHIRLANCLAVVLNQRQLSTEVMCRVRQVALDTSRGCTLDIAKCLYETWPDGRMEKTIGLLCNQTRYKVSELLRFLVAIEVVEPYTVQLAKGVRSAQQHWRLTDNMAELYENVLEGS